VTSPGGSCRQRRGRAASTTPEPLPLARPPAQAARPAAPTSARGGLGHRSGADDDSTPRPPTPRRQCHCRLQPPRAT
jgi:hypothetical protein